MRAAARCLQRVPELTLYRQRPGSMEERERIATLPYQRPSRPTWIHQARDAQQRSISISFQKHCFFLLS